MKGMNNTGPIDTTYDIDMMVIVVIVVVVVVVVVENFSIHFYFILLYLLKQNIYWLVFLNKK